MKYRIFIVEDDETIANLLKKHLSSWGYDVFLAEDFSNILQEFAGKDPQLVLLDLKLPFYNGFHWCEEIRKVSQVPVIFISSAADNMNMVMAMSRGADDFIAKPFRWMEVNGMFSWGDWRWNGTAKGFMMNTEGQIMANSRGEVVTDMSNVDQYKYTIEMVQVGDYRVV